MLDLNEIRVILFDFDDTLCVHTQRPQAMALPDDVYSEKVLSGENPWVDGVAPEVLRRFVNLCAELNIAMGLISGTSAHMRSEAKIQWVKEHYGVTMENYCVGSQGYKKHMLYAICHHRHLQPSEVLFVDDVYDNLEEVASEGYIACSPMEIVYFMEQHGY